MSRFKITIQFLVSFLFTIAILSIIAVVPKYRYCTNHYSSVQAAILQNVKDYAESLQTAYPSNELGIIISNLDISSLDKTLEDANYHLKNHLYY